MYGYALSIYNVVYLTVLWANIHNSQSFIDKSNGYILPINFMEIDEEKKKTGMRIINNIHMNTSRRIGIYTIYYIIPPIIR